MATAKDLWEEKLHDASATPISLPFDFLETITCDFSSEQELGRGGYGVVYKGVLQSGKIIAVKKLFDIHLVDDNKFHNEVSYLMEVKHQNIVQFVGYCAESSWKAMKPEGSGNYIMVEIPKRLLCFEYVCNESLHKYVSDESSGLEWNMRYEIIRGICNGLHYLHEECHIVHLDLKPENILMDANMVPKIADFGLSRIFGENQSRTITESRAGSRGYMAPEYIIQGVVSIKADIFSLGVIIIQIVTGRRDYPQSDVPDLQHFNQNNSSQSMDTSFEHYKEKIYQLWRNRLQKSHGATEKIEQIRVCVELGLQCTEFSPAKRPVTQHIIDRLDKVSIKDESYKAGVSTSAVVQAGGPSNALQQGDTGTIVDKASILPTHIEEFVQVQVPAVSIQANENGIPTQKDNSTSPVFPDAFRCPLSLGLMQDPVTVATGQTYDRGSIMRWLNSGHDTCPTTQQKLVNKSLIPNHNLHSLIAKWCDANGLEQPKRSGQVSSNATAESQLTAYEQAQVVHELLKKLSSENVVHQRGAAGMLRQLAKRSPEYRASIGDSGGIHFLVSMLRTDDVSTQEHVVTTLLNVSIPDENKIRLVRSGAIPAIVYVLESGSMVARENAAEALFSLSKLNENRVIIGAAGSIPPLILLLRTGSRPGKKNAAAALFNVCNYQGNKSIAIRAGLVPILLELLMGTENGLVDVALSILDVLSSHPEGKAAISAAAAIPSLVAVIRNESPRNKENAAAILLHLCNGRGAQQQQSRAEAQEQGLVSLLVDLAESGTDRGKSKAIKLLELMNTPST